MNVADLELRWGRLSLDEHDRRLAALRHEEETITVAMAFHEYAIEAIASTPGASCLADVAELSETS